MGLAEKKFIRLVVIKEWGAEVLRKTYPPLILWEPFKVTAPSQTVIDNWEPNWQWRTKLQLGHSYKDWQRRDKKILNRFPMARWTFFLVIFHLSMGKAAISCRHWPGRNVYCKLNLMLNYWRSIFLTMHLFCLSLSICSLCVACIYCLAMQILTPVITLYFRIFPNIS